MVILTTMCFIEVVRAVVDTGITRLQRQTKMSNHRQVIRNSSLHSIIQFLDKVGPFNRSNGVLRCGGLARSDDV